MNARYFAQAVDFACRQCIWVRWSAVVLAGLAFPIPVYSRCSGWDYSCRRPRSAYPAAHRTMFWRDRYIELEDEPTAAGRLYRAVFKR